MSRIVVCLLAGALSSCALTPITPPTTAPGTPAYVSSSPPSSSQVYGAELEPDSYIGVGQTFAGYTAPSGGPGFSASTIRTTSNLDAVKPTGLLSIDLGALVTTLRSEYARPASPLSGAYFELTPAAVMDFDRTGTFTLGCFLHARLVNGDERWAARYVVQDSPTFLPSSPTLLQDAKAHLSDCFGRSTELFALHTGNHPNLLRDALVGPKAERMKVVASLLPDRLVVFDHLGLWEHDKGATRRTTVVLQ